MSSHVADGDGVHGALHSYPKSGTLQRIEEHREAVYNRSKMGPLGKPYERGFTLPQGLGTDIPFGTGHSPGVQELLLSEPQAEVAKPEKRSPALDWDRLGIDLEHHRFGSIPEKCKAANEALPDVRQSMKQISTASDEGSPDHMQLIRYHHLKEAPLGRTKQIIYGDHIDSSAVYGIQTKKEVHGVAEIMKDPLDKEMKDRLRQPPVGKSGSDMSSLNGVAAHGKRVRPKEMGADLLISPPRCVTLGLDVKEHRKPRSKKQLQEMLQLSGIHVGDDAFEAIFQSASQADGAANVSCSLASFMHARQQHLAMALPSISDKEHQH